MKKKTWYINEKELVQCVTDPHTSYQVLRQRRVQRISQVIIDFINLLVNDVIIFDKREFLYPGLRVICKVASIDFDFGSLICEALFISP